MIYKEAIKEAKIQIDAYENMISYCKYFEPKEDTSKYEYRIEFLKTAIKALEKQIPMKPKEYEDKFYACPVCGNVVHHKWVKYPTKLMPKLVGLPYCLNCGQLLN